MQLRTFLIAGAASFMAALDTLVVTTALPTIREQFGASLESMEWTVNVFTLCYAVFLLTAAALGDRFGRKRVFVLGLVLFTGSSAAAALAGSIGLLVLARAIQGLGTAMIIPLALTLLVSATPPERRGAAIAGLGGMVGLGIALGPWIGGAVVQYGSWQAVFWINVPVGLVLVPLAALLLAEGGRVQRRLDVRGILLMMAGLFGVVFGLIRSVTLGWSHVQVLPPIVAGVAVLVAFAWWERVAPEPVLPPRLFRSRGFTLSNVVSTLVQGGMLGAVFLLTQFLQLVLAYGPLDAGVRTLPWTLLPAVVAPLAGVFGERLGVRRLMVASAILQGAALACFAVVVAPAVPYALLWPGMVVAGAGMGLFYAVAARQPLDFVAPAEEGLAAGVNNAMRQIGIVLGVAVLAGVFAAGGGYGTPALFVSGLRAALWVGAAILAVAAVAAWLVPAVPARKGPGSQALTTAASGSDQPAQPLAP
jgi:EmrB/QacA subfamily drug resistance transporter